MDIEEEIGSLQLDSAEDNGLVNPDEAKPEVDYENKMEEDSREEIHTQSDKSVVVEHRDFFFAELQNREREFGMADIQLGLTTLEEVFLNIAGQAELEAAMAEGKLVTLTLASDASVQIPVGARFVGIPGTECAEHPSGVMVEVFWQQDDSGALCISSHSPETPIPPNVEITPSCRDSVGQGRSRGQSRPVQGIVINPDQISIRHSLSNF